MVKIELPSEKSGVPDPFRVPSAITAQEFNALSFDDHLAMVRMGISRAKERVREEGNTAVLIRARLSLSGWLW